MEHINGAMLKEMIIAGANRLDSQKKSVDALNVFPVPDGDTGTNMSLTLLSAVKEINKVSAASLSAVAGALSSGSLMGARGNSGVILSQIFRGVAKSIGDKKEISAKEVAAALQEGAKTAYRAVMRPVEGTILTVAREVAEGAITAAYDTTDVGEVLEKAIAHGRIALENTPELLPVLKHAGVVDAGGKGYILIMEGALMAIRGDFVPVVEDITDVAMAEPEPQEKKKKLLYPYCTELLLQRNGDSLSESVIRRRLEQWGDSMLVVGSGELIKIHIHTNDPGTVLNYCCKLGEMRDIKIDNMNYQHRSTLTEEEEAMLYDEEDTGTESEHDWVLKKPYGLVAVAAGEGLAETLRSLGVDMVVTGGQTMNPSTEDLARAARELPAEKIIILPNNSNIILAAQQVHEVLDRPVIVVPTRSVPEGIGAVLAFDPETEPEENRVKMTAAAELIKTGEVTYAVRATRMNGLDVKEGDVIGIADREIRVAGQEAQDVVLRLLDSMIGAEDSLVTLYYGDMVEAQDAEDLLAETAERFDSLDVEMYPGGQPLYYYLISVE